MTRLLSMALVGVLSIAGGSDARAEYPARPVTLVVPYAAGGSNDVLSRLMAEGMAKVLGQPVIIENEPGAAGTTAVTRVARAAADGYTLIMGNMGTHGVAPSQYPNLQYDPVRDFTPIGMVAGVPAIIVARKDFPAGSLREFIEYLRAHQDRVNEAHVGVGSPTHTFCTLLQSMIGVKTGRVAYRGGSQAMADLISGQVDFSCISLSGAISQIQGGLLKGIAIASSERAEALPSVPTTKEGGLPDFIVSTWNALFAPKGLPKDVQSKLNRALSAAIEDEHTRRRLVELGFVVPAPHERTPGALRTLVESEVSRWAKVVKSSGPGTQ